MVDSPVAAYQIKQTNGAFKLVGESYNFKPYGIAIPKNNGMAAPMLAALKLLMSNGTYAQILTKWGIQSGAISTPITLRTRFLPLMRTGASVSNSRKSVGERPVDFRNRRLKYSSSS